MNSKSTLILLHGALGSAAQMKPLAVLLQDDFTVVVPDFYGHGGNDPGEQPFSMAGFTSQLSELINKIDSSSVYIFGYSMGGFVGMYFAASHPGKVKGVFTLATKFDWSPETARKETAMLVPDTMMEKIPAFVSDLQERHKPTAWQSVVTRTSGFMNELGSNPEILNMVKSVACKARLAVGDRDKMAGVEATVEMFRQLQNATLQVIPSTPHPFEKTDLRKLADDIRNFVLS